MVYKKFSALSGWCCCRSRLKPAKIKHNREVCKTFSQFYCGIFSRTKLFVKNITIIFEAESKIPENMFGFQQYLGFLLFLTIATIGFWLMMFLVSFVFYWVTGATVELIKERKAMRNE